MRVGVEKDVVAEEGLNMEKGKGLEYTFFVARGASRGSQGRSPRSRNRIPDIRMLSHQVLCILDIVLAVLTA